MFRCRQRRLKHAVNAMVKSIFEELKKRDVSTLVMGNLTGIRANARYGAKTNQKLHNFWPFSVIQNRISELGEEHGIAIKKVSERNTSKTCCLCGRQHNGRKHRGLMVCPEKHQSINADVNGAVNILYVAMNRFPSVLHTNEREISGSRLLAEPLLLRWNYNEWK